MIIYKKENYDLYRFAEKFDCNQLEEKRYVTGSSNTVCGKTMFLRNEVTLQIRSDLNNQDISEFIATIVAN